MLDGIGREIFGSLMPDGPIGVPKVGGDLDKLLEGMGDNLDSLLAFLGDLKNLRNPLLTTFLDELESDYGIVDAGTISDTLRRQRLFSVKTEARCDGSAEYLQERLQSSGFNIQVHNNDPPSDPSAILQKPATLVLGSTISMGNPMAVMGATSGELVVNGFVGGSRYENWVIPPDDEYWPLIFFAGGDATRDIDGKIISVAKVLLPVERREEIRRLIIKYKPMHTWCGLVVYYN